VYTAVFLDVCRTVHCSLHSRFTLESAGSYSVSYTAVLPSSLQDHTLLSAQPFFFESAGSYSVVYTAVLPWSLQDHTLYCSMPFYVLVCRTVLYCTQPFYLGFCRTVLCSVHSRVTLESAGPYSLMYTAVLPWSLHDRNLYCTQPFYLGVCRTYSLVYTAVLTWSLQGRTL